MGKNFNMAVLLLVASTACQKPDQIIKTIDIHKDVIVDVTIPTIGSYSFNGKEYPFYTALSSEGEDWVDFTFAREPKAPYKSVFYFAISREYLGREIDINTLYKRVDYRLIFETPSVYYAEYYAPRKGTIKIVPMGYDEYEIDINLELADGKPFSLHYQGTF